MPIRILVVEDNPTIREKLVGLLRRGSPEVELVEAGTYEEAHRVYDIHGGVFDGIILDGCLNDRHDADGATFLSDVRRLGFEGPIVAASESDGLNCHMVADRGATAKIREVNGFRGLKESAPGIILKLIGR